MSASDNTSPKAQPQELWVCHLGTVPYQRALAIQEQIRDARQADELPDTLLTLEHPPVYTRGRRSHEDELPLGEEFYRAQGIEVLGTDRGGRLTYHSPGQLVGYPIMRIADIDSYLRTMERAIVAALGDEGITSRSRSEEGPDYTGVWVTDRKIASIGVHISRGVTTHGFAVNVENDLEPFSWVVPCGLRDVAMTSLQRELAVEHAGLMGAFREHVRSRFAEAHNRQMRHVSPADLRLTEPSGREHEARMTLNA
jgi:lipoyl(octanoyl) transferase